MRVPSRAKTAPPAILDAPPRPEPVDRPDARSYGIRMGLADVKGINDAEVARITAGRPYPTLADFWHRAQVSRPVVERLVVAGAFDSLYGLGSTLPVRRRGQVTRRDLLLQVAELDSWTRATRRAASRGAPTRGAPTRGAPTRGRRSQALPEPAGPADVRELAARQSQAPKAVQPVDVQLSLDLGDEPDEVHPTGLPEMTDAERVRAELEVLGLDVSRHVLDFYAPFLAELGVTRSRDLARCRSRQEVLVAGVKVATQTPPIRPGRRVVFVTLDDASGPVDGGSAGRHDGSAVRKRPGVRDRLPSVALHRHQAGWNRLRSASQALALEPRQLRWLTRRASSALPPNLSRKTVGAIRHSM